MVDDNSASSRQARREFLEKWSKLTEKINKDWQEVVKSNHFDRKQIEKYLSDYDEKSREIHFIYSRWREKGKIGFDKVKVDILFHESKFLSLLSQVDEIQKQPCNKCGKKLSEKNCYLYSSEKRSIIKWTIEQVLNFKHDFFYTLFCSPSCFKNSIYSPQPKTKTEPNSRQTHHNQNSEENSNYCSECNQELISKYYYHKTKHDNEKFCSQKCFTNFYGETCLRCWNKFLEIYPLSESQSEFTYCWDCLQKEHAEEAKRKAEQAARFNFDGKKHVQKILEAMKKGLKEKIERENQEQAEKEALENQEQEQLNNQSRESERNLDSDKEQRTKNKEQRTKNKEQRTKNKEQRTKNKDTPDSTSNPNLKTQINSLASEIKALESNQTNQNLLNSKKAELEELQKQQQIQTKPNNQKLYLGIGLGVLGGVLVGLVIYLVAKKKS